MKLNEVYRRRNRDQTEDDQDWELKNLDALAEGFNRPPDEVVHQRKELCHDLDMEKAISGADKPDSLSLQFLPDTCTDDEGIEIKSGKCMIDSDSEEAEFPSKTEARVLMN